MCDLLFIHYEQHVEYFSCTQFQMCEPSLQSKVCCNLWPLRLADWCRVTCQRRDVSTALPVRCLKLPLHPTNVSGVWLKKRPNLFSFCSTVARKLGFCSSTSFQWMLDLRPCLLSLFLSFYSICRDTRGFPINDKSCVSCVSHCSSSIAWTLIVNLPQNINKPRCKMRVKRINVKLGS